ncbi:MAG: type 4a pilus biogenesis protein PilO [Candidatus Sulfobium sp.]|jgi:type IV pilus assembly protein PilO
MARPDIRSLPSYARIIIAVLPAVLISAIVIIFMVMPRQKEIKQLDARLDKQNNEIAAAQAKVARLDVLIKENERLKVRWDELKQQLPEESEVSGLLKQVSDKSLASGLDMRSWRPGSKRVYPGGVVYEIPVSVQVSGTFHNFGGFLGSLTRLNRIVNVNNIQMGSPKLKGGSSILQISFTAATYSAIPEKEIGKGKKGGRGRK